MIFSGSTQLPIKFIISFTFTDKWYSMVYMYHNFITLLSELDHLGFFYFLNTVNKSSIAHAKQIPVEYDGMSYGHMPRSGHMTELILAL